LAEGIVASADHVDAGVVFGTGFAPFRGGPLHYRREQQKRAAVASSQSIASHAAE
jgi:3-hydroxyacyl-CoA dehydrogenase/enoyl-CoA hydratase/3-hydroxybutyryl-CoA epimerase